MTIEISNETPFNSPTQEILPEIPRYVPPNPLNLSKLDIIQRKREVGDLQKMYPFVPVNLIEDAWDFHYIKGENAIREMINSGEFEKPYKGFGEQ